MGPYFLIGPSSGSLFMNKTQDESLLKLNDESIQLHIARTMDELDPIMQLG